MIYEVRWMPRARRRVAAQQTWWVEQRAAAPMRFREELARGIGLLEQYPELGIRSRT